MEYYTLGKKKSILMRILKCIERNRELVFEETIEKFVGD